MSGGLTEAKSLRRLTQAFRMVALCCSFGSVTVSQPPGKHSIPRECIPKASSKQSCRESAHCEGMRPSPKAVRVIVGELGTGASEMGLKVQVPNRCQQCLICTYVCSCDG